MRNQLKRFTHVLCLIIMVAVILSAFVSCGTTKKEVSDTSVTESETKAAKTVTVTVTDDKGVDTVFNIKTDGETLRDALDSVNLVQGDEGPYGLYVKVVNGIKADYDEDGAYWAFSKDGEYLNTGIDQTPVCDGDKFEIVYTK